MLDAVQRVEAWRMGGHGHWLTTLTIRLTSRRHQRWRKNGLPEVADFTKAAIFVMNRDEFIRHLPQPTTTKLISGRRWQCVPLALLSDTDIGNGADSQRSNACNQVNG